MPVTLSQIYELEQEILSSVKRYNEEQIALLRESLTKLDDVYEGIKTLSDNQVVIDDHISEVRSTVRELRGLLPGV